jgi:hypothetical protein
MVALSTRTREAEIFDKIIARITDADLMKSVVQDLYKEISEADSESIFGNSEVPDMQEILVALNEENLDTIEYFYGLCEEDTFLPRAIERYIEEVFPHLEDSVECILCGFCLPYRNTNVSYGFVFNDRVLPCQNILIKELSW